MFCMLGNWSFNGSKQFSSLKYTFGARKSDEKLYKTYNLIEH